jgi:hypothetical protein
MTTYRIGTEIADKADENFEALLAGVHNTKERPVCLCTPQGAEMYVVRLDGRYHIKRMPNTGGDHDPSSCSSYEAPAELSGLGQVMGSAIIESPEMGTTALKLQFSLTKSSGRASPSTGEGEADSVKTDGNKLSLRALLHFLWEQAGFHKWSPAMHGKRNWAVLRKYLLQAGQHKNTKGSELSQLLYIPEPFHVDRKEEIARRRVAHLSRIAEGTMHSSSRKLMLLIADVKELVPSRNGHKMVAKHLSDYPLMMNPDLHKRLLKRFERELSLWDSIDGAHLVAIATFGVNNAGVATIDEIGLMTTTDNWIPFESLSEKSLIDTLSRDGRKFAKGLRYNLGASRPLATAVLLDTSVPTAMYIHPPGVGDDYAIALDELISGSKMESWVWHPDSGEMPALPRAAPSRPIIPDAFTGMDQAERLPRHAG